MDLTTNKVFKFYFDELEKYNQKPRKQWFDEGELEALPEKKQAKLIKKVEGLFIDIIRHSNAAAPLFEKAIDDMNGITHPIIGVLVGMNRGSTGLGTENFVLVATTNNVYVYKKTDVLATNHFGLIGMLGKAIKRSTSAYERKEFSLQEFYDSALIGNQYSGFGDDFINWSYGGFFHKYKVHYIMRPMYRALITKVEKILNGEEKVEENIENQVEKASPSYTDELRSLKSLLDEGIITQEEFDEKKKKILDL